MLTRRHLLALFTKLGLSSASLRAAIPPGTFQIDRLQSEHAWSPARNAFRAYRADAVITLFSMPVFSRAGVGGGIATFGEGLDGGRRIVSMSFAGGSFPEHAHKINRLGYIQEVVLENREVVLENQELVLENDNEPQEAAYFGFMTASPEESVAEARKALASSGASIPYAAVEGVTSRGQHRNSKTKIFLPSSYTFAEWRTLRDRIRAAFYASDPSTTEIAAPPRTLLYSVAQAIRRPAGRFETPYVYNGKQYHLKLEKTPDSGAGTAFVNKGLAASAAGVYLLRGSVKGLLSGRVTNFRLWIDDDSGTVLPLRIELQPRSFLRLAFEFDPALSKGPLPKGPNSKDNA
ncbi:MAG TPA: hypothetical protein VKG25_06035 [Bryobacteraceae bacterium]|nr:hypothetical protein [Bryobacteraceae bacterium]